MAGSVNRNYKRSSQTAKVTRNIRNSIWSSYKSLSAMQVVLIIFCLLLGLAGGLFTGYKLTEHDNFFVNGESCMEYPCSEGYLRYRDEGVTVISFNDHIEDRVSVTTNMTMENGEYVIDLSHPGTYYIAYTVDSIKYQNVQRVRTIIIGGFGNGSQKE